MAIKIITIILMAVLAGWSYRFGGSANGKRWVREVGVGVATIITLAILFGWNWWLLLIMGSVWIETTYFKKKGSDAKWWNWAIVGLSYSIVALPWVIATHSWVGFFIRTIFLVPTISLWRTFVGNVQWQESGCGIIQILSITLFLLRI